MQQSSPNPAATSASPRTVTITEQPADGTQLTTTQEQLMMRLESPDTRPRVQWSTDTVDNENMGKKKSKCCCMYKKKRNWDESDSEEEECESEHCRGHVEKHRKPPSAEDGNGNGEGPSNSNN